MGKSSVPSAHVGVVQPEPIDKNGLIELLDTRLHFYQTMVLRFQSLYDKVSGLPDGFQFDITPEYGGASVVGYKLTIKL